MNMDFGILGLGLIVGPWASYFTILNASFLNW